MAASAQFEREIIASRITETRAYPKKHGRRGVGHLLVGAPASREAPSYALIAPDWMPRMKRFIVKKKSTMSGRLASVAPAIWRP